jgi:hypothetical protein
MLAVAMGFLMARDENWAFVQSVGGISIGEPVREGSGWILPVRADLSGFSKITVQPTAHNSGMACRETRATVTRNTILLVVVSTVAGDGREARCPPAHLGALTPGTYSVAYGAAPESAVALGSVVIAP